MTMEKRIRAALEENIAVTQKFLKTLAPRIAEATRICLGALKKGRKILVFGNGGSAADAQHFACELVGRFKRDRAALPAIALSANTSNLTAIANDHGFDMIFERQVEALAQRGDVCFAITTSGNSPNVLRALKAARTIRAATVCLSGKGGGKAKALCDLCITVPSDETPRIQEAHITIIHIICALIEETLFAAGSHVRTGRRTKAKR
jgi:D-sedoheptulose 7-phosphate isomerase